MKKFILFFFALVASVCAFAQGTADFYTLEPSSSYKTYTTTAGWVIENGCVHGGASDPSSADNPHFTLFGDNDGAVAAVINGKTTAPGTITSPVLEGGCGTLSLNYAYMFGESNGVSFHVAIVQNDATVAEYDVIDTEIATKTVGSWSQKVNVAGDFKIIITNNCPTQSTSNKDRYSIWNLSWKGYVPSEGSQITSLDQLKNDQAYSIHALTNEGYLCYNPEVSETSVSLCGVTDHSYQGSVGNPAWELPYNAADPNHAWQIACADEKYYVYNVGAKKFLGFVGNTYKFVDEPVEIDFRANADEETVDGHSDLSLGGSFSIRIASGNDQQYVCVCTKNAEDPVKWWTFNDHGGPMLIEEVEVATDDILTIISGEVKQKELNETLAATIAEVAAAYAENSEYEVGANLITENGQFTSPYTEPKEGSIDNLLDGNDETFWHSTWSATDGAPVVGEDGTSVHVHYLQVTLPESITGEVQMTMTRRVKSNHGVIANDHPVKMSVEASLDDNEYVNAGSMDLPFPGDSYIDDPVVKATFSLSSAAKYLRFFSDGSNGGNNRGYWHCSEFQLNPVTLTIDCYNAQNPNSAAALVEALAVARTIENATEADIKALQNAYEAYLAGDNAPVPATPVYCTAAQLRENAEKGRFALLGVTATGDHYLNGEAGDHVSADGTLAGVRDPEANEIVYLVKSGDQYLIQREDTKQFFQIAAGQNIVLVDDATAATPFEIYGKDDAGYPTGGFDDLFSDLAKAYDEYMIRFKANGQWLNTQGANAIGGLRGGTGAWSFQYVRYMGEHETVTPEPEPDFWEGEAPTVDVTESTDDVAVKVTFNGAASVEATNYGVLAAIFDENGDAYAIAFNTLFGETVEFNKGTATLHFKKISDIREEYSNAIAESCSRIKGAVGGVDITGKVIILGKSFKVDGGKIYNDDIVADYKVDGGNITTGINGVAIDADAKIFDLQGRRIAAPVKGLNIQNSKKVVR